MADGMATGSYFLNLISGMLNRTSSHMCGRWYFPIFLLRDGLLTLRYKAPLMVLMRSWSSPTLTSDLVPAPEEEEEERGDKDSGLQQDLSEDTEGIEGFTWFTLASNTPETV